MEYCQEGSTFTVLSPLSASNVLGQHNKIGSIIFGATLVRIHTYMYICSEITYTHIYMYTHTQNTITLLLSTNTHLPIQLPANWHFIIPLLSHHPLDQCQATPQAAACPQTALHRFKAFYTMMSNGIPLT